MHSEADSDVGVCHARHNNQHTQLLLPTKQIGQLQVSSNARAAMRHAAELRPGLQVQP
jgi:hypothetical protein